jgi:hypothetical protein
VGRRDEDPVRNTGPALLRAPWLTRCRSWEEMHTRLGFADWGAQANASAKKAIKS